MDESDRTEVGAQVEIVQTPTFSIWLRTLKDAQARGRIAARIRRIRFGNPGDVRSVGDGVSEMRVDVGPGYRVYFVRRRRTVVVLLCGGDKSSQKRDIASAKGMAAKLEGEAR